MEAAVLTHEPVRSNGYNRYPNIHIDKPIFVSAEIMDDETPNKRIDSSYSFTTNVKIGIIKDLHAKQLITEMQMDKAILKLKQEVHENVESSRILQG